VKLSGFLGLGQGDAGPRRPLGQGAHGYIAETCRTSAQVRYCNIQQRVFKLRHIEKKDRRVRDALVAYGPGLS
jgi:hypothetical protein